MTLDQNSIVLTKKEASITATVLVLLGLLLFVAGYFWGKQTVIDDFAHKTSQESFNDQVDCLLTMQSYAAKNGTPLTMDSVIEELPTEQEIKNVAVAEQKDVSTSQALVQEPEQSIEIVAPQGTKKSGKHFATLAGFAKKNAAEQMVARLKKRNIDVVVKTKTGRSASGKVQKNWYQVVTLSYDSRRVLRGRARG